MGTSGSYGGSAKQVWKDARQQILDLPPGAGSGDSGGGEQPSEKPLEDLWGSIGDALDSDDPSLHRPIVDESKIALPARIPWLGRPGRGSSGSDGGSDGGGNGRVRSGAGRQGSGSRRQVTRSAARGGAALGAAYAVRRGDADYLKELGLDLTRLQGLSPIRQCAEILDAVLGEGAHPDEMALRNASLEALKDVLTKGEPPDEMVSLRAFVVSYVFELSLVELQRQVNEGALSPDGVAKKERTIRVYLEKRVQNLPIPGGGVIQPRDLRTRAAELTKEVIKLLRARGGGTP
ncbi:hypothetical protein OQ729_22860 [Mycobacterium ulcerans]|uniref:Uncharacterized protein n=1 Tax=Mycobacterium ulcerans (strain Agy99) TaxID=362242 RepID=A0PSW3_MYCUA|nr:conserved hypothetical protein [Mycobacterium ulcerans Agy99]MEB3948101.1 hypothetical protein [Mycobacterium ulcerans]MEB4041632.1 hypothetical protein [Mycobacterium ulcerans]MEB4128497.1 hypothetical protein [Mycobacterium ulcerans]MEB4145065.1 hypothetical protein [Mycobacterium ulcerans]